MKSILFSASLTLFLFGASSCSRCYVCTDKNSKTFTKIEYCSKDFDKGDVDAAIKAAEADGASCRAKLRAI